MTQRMMQAALTPVKQPQPTEDSISAEMRLVIQHNFRRNIALQNALFRFLDKLNRADSFNKSYCFEGFSCFLAGVLLMIDLRETDDFEALQALSQALSVRWEIYAKGVVA